MSGAKWWKTSTGESEMGIVGPNRLVKGMMVTGDNVADQEEACLEAGCVVLLEGFIGIDTIRPGLLEV